MKWSLVYKVITNNIHSQAILICQICLNDQISQLVTKCADILQARYNKFYFIIQYASCSRLSWLLISFWVTFNILNWLMMKIINCIILQSQQNARFQQLHHVYLCVTEVIWDWVSPWSNNLCVADVIWPQRAWEESGDSLRSFINRSGPDTQPIKHKPAAKLLDSCKMWQ